MDQITRAISDADIAIAVIDKETDANLYYELGMAHALFKRVLIFVSPSVQKLPSDIAGLSYIRAEPSNREAISFAISSIVKAEQIGRSSQKVHVYPSRPLGELASHFLSNLDSLAGQDEERIEDLVVSALGKSGISVIARSENKDIGADLAVWVDELDPLIGNPLLIEIKREIKSQSHFNEIVKQVQGYLTRTSSKVGIVLYGTIRVPIPVFTFPILFLSLKELIEKLRTESFAKIVTDLRNSQVHGAR